jgi:hypothetical protein
MDGVRLKLVGGVGTNDPDQNTTAQDVLPNKAAEFENVEMTRCSISGPILRRADLRRAPTACCLVVVGMSALKYFRRSGRGFRSPNSALAQISETRARAE